MRERHTVVWIRRIVSVAPVHTYLDFVIVLLTPHTQKVIVQFDPVPTTRREECSLFLREIDQNIARCFPNARRLHDPLLQLFRSGGGLLVSGVRVGARRNIKANGNFGKSLSM